MQYMLLIYDPEKNWRSLPPDQYEALHAEYLQFTNDIKASGHFRAGDALQPTHTATTVRIRDGKTAFTDGPFAETREQLGGYYLIECADLDEALSIAGRVPSLRAGGAIEVRPVLAPSLL